MALTYKEELVVGNVEVAGVRRRGGGERLTGQEHLCPGDRNEG